MMNHEAIFTFTTHPSAQNFYNKVFSKYPEIHIRRPLKENPLYRVMVTLTFEEEFSDCIEISNQYGGTLQNYPRRMESAESLLDELKTRLTGEIHENEKKVLLSELANLYLKISDIFESLHANSLVLDDWKQNRLQEMVDEE